MNDASQKHGYLASLAFDYVSPQTATAAVHQLGLPAGLTNTLQRQWSNQQRILQWNKSCYPHILHTNISVPQGDPFSPLALSAIMWAGCRYVEHRAPTAAANRVHAVYMDDRTFTANTPTLLASTLAQWSTYSTLVGLQENQSKTQLTAAIPAKLRAWRRHFHNNVALQQCISNTAFILGSSASNSSSGNQVQSLHPKEQARFTAAEATLKRVRFLPVSHSVKMQTAQLMAATKAAYGWVAHSPSMKDIKTFTKALKACSSVFHSSSTPLQNMLTRAHLDLGAVVGRRQVLLWCKKAQQPIDWQSPSAHLAANWLRDHGWSWQQKQQQWHHRLLNLDIVPQQANSADGYHAITHKLREGWRHKQWHIFRASTRRDATPSSTHLTSRIDSTSFAALFRRVLEPPLAVLLWSAISPAAFGKRPGVRQQRTRCPMCRAPMADLKHIYWQCPQRLTTPSPRDQLQARFGWPSCQGDLTTFRQLSDTVELLWKERHADRDYGHREYISCDWRPTRKKRK